MVGGLDEIFKEHRSSIIKEDEKATREREDCYFVCVFQTDDVSFEFCSVFIPPSAPSAIARLRAHASSAHRWLAFAMIIYFF